jgi:hypothetical protein
MSNTAMMMGLSSGAGGVDVADVFSTTLYTGNATADTKITTDVDLQTNGGLLWTKKRSASADHYLWDSINAFDGGTSTTYSSKRIKSNATDAMSTEANALMSFETDGFVVSTNGAINGSGSTYVSWSFLQASKFFDCVQYSGTGSSGHVIDHALNNEVGMILIKNISAGANWKVWHRSLASGTGLVLNSTNSVEGIGYINNNNNDVTDSSITMGVAGNETNTSGNDYIMYLFAHNEDLIQCGSFVQGTSSYDVDLGFEPQWLLIKSATSATNWYLFDNKRGVVTGGNDAVLLANGTAAEASTDPYLDFTSSGFTSHLDQITGNQTYIYMAIKAE